VPGDAVDGIQIIEDLEYVHCAPWPRARRRDSTRTDRGRAVGSAPGSGWPRANRPRAQASQVEKELPHVGARFRSRVATGSSEGIGARLYTPAAKNAGPGVPRRWSGEHTGSPNSAKVLYTAKADRVRRRCEVADGNEGRNFAGRPAIPIGVAGNDLRFTTPET